MRFDVLNQIMYSKILKTIKKFGIDELETCVYIDESGKVEGKYPVSVYSGDFDSFLSMLDGEDEDY